MHFLYHPHREICPKTWRYDAQILNQNMREFSSAAAVVVVAVAAAFAVVVGVVKTHFCDRLRRRTGHQ